jgi:carboxypeptidase C (cathepsin A)
MPDMIARSLAGTVLALLVMGCGEPAMAQGPVRDPKDATKAEGKAEPKGDPVLPHHFVPEEKVTTGSVTVGRQRIDYRAVAGTLVVHPKGWDDVSARLNTEEEKSGKPPSGEEKEGEKGKPLTKAEASMFFVAYFKQGAPADSRPITFLYNGGPGSATVWLHMGAFGPRSVVTPGDKHLPAAPYSLVNNDNSLLDVSDLVFIDAPGAGFSRITGPDKEKAFWGVDADAYAFAEFITQFLGKYGRWNSPKYLFGESYGTTRSAVLVNQLETQRMVDFNGVILLSQILNFGLNPDTPEADPGAELPYELALPTYAATAWYHHKLGSDVPQDLGALVNEVEHFAITEYAVALQQGAALSDADRDSIAAKLHKYTGLPVDYIRKARLRITGGEFEKELQDAQDTTTGRLDTRFEGPAMDALEKTADYDPFSASVGSAYVTAFNDYVRKELKFGEDRAFLPRAPVFGKWEMGHHPPGDNQPWGSSLNVMIDLATAMKYNPNLKVQLEAGYFDLATPFFQGVYEMQHLPMPDKLQSNIEYKFYQSGHMVYAQDTSHRALHDNVADFIRRTSAPMPPRAGAGR